ncbi:MAG TPA: HlyD family efflux transporter periplasmic adaptor subunit [Usitatibacter sp.]|nr:HlyD family efflux transporter periplasmic adaptor subunit [Usitatibacter sp.]
MARKPLFRAESEDARSNAWLGKVILTRPTSFGVLAMGAVVFAIALAAFFILGEYTRKTRVVGVLAPEQGIVRIIAQQSGVVEAVHAIEGAAVAKEAPLIVLGDGRAGHARQEIGAAVRDRLAERRHALRRQREHTMATITAEQAGVRQRALGLSREIIQVESEMDSQQARAQLAIKSVDRVKGLEQVGFLSTAAADRERDAALDQGGRLESLRRTRMALERERAAIEFDGEMALARARAQLAAIDGQHAATEQEGLERELQYRAAIVAPSAGIVATVLVERGQMVTAGTPLLAIIPADATLEAHLYAPSRAIGFVHAGQDVLLRYLAYPHQKFGMHRASVVAVSRNPMTPTDLGFTPPDGSREPLYRIKARIDAQAIAAYGRIEPLQPGMQIEADILLDRRRLIEWIFEPLLGLAGRA